MKTCSKCKKEKDLKSFGNRKSNKGKIIKNSICRDCLRIKAQNYRKKNKEELSLYNKERYLKKKESILENNENWRKTKKYESWREKNNEKIKQYRKQYYLKNKEKILKQNKHNHYKKLKEDITYRLKHNIRVNISKSFKRKGYNKNSKTQDILGCTFQEFRNHLESQFKNWMNWENYGLYNGNFNFGWDVDHIVSIKNANSKEDVINLNHFTNLQPLCSKLNRDIKK